MALPLQYALQLSNAAFTGPANQARQATDALGRSTDVAGAKVGGLRTSFTATSASIGGFIDKAGHLGANISNIVSGVKAANEVVQYLRGTTATATTAVSSMSTSVATAAVRASAMGTGARIAGAGVGFLGAAAGGAAVGIGAMTAAAGVIMAPLLALAAAVAAVKVAFEGISVAADMEQLQTAMTAITGSTADATAVIAELKVVAKETGGNVMELAQAAKGLLAEKIPQGALSGEIKALSVIAKVTGSDLAGIALAYKQVASAGRVYGDELNQFSERGAGAIKAKMIEMAGVSGAQFRKMQEDGLVTFSMLQQAIQALAGPSGEWTSILKEGSDDTWELLKQIGAAVKDIFLAFGQPINDGPVKAVLKGVLSVVQTVRDAVTTSMAVLNTVIADGNIGEVLANGLILGAKMGWNAVVEGAKLAVTSVIEFVQSIPSRVASALTTVGEAIKAALTGSIEAAREILGSFQMDSGTFDTSKQDAFFDGILNRSKQASQAAKDVGKDWAKALDSGAAEKEGKVKSGGGRSGGGTGTMQNDAAPPMPKGRISRGTIRRGDGDLIGLPEGFTPRLDDSGKPIKLSGLDMHDLLNERRKSRIPGTTEIGTSRDLVIPIGQGFDKGTNPKGLGVKTAFPGLDKFKELQAAGRKLGDKALPTPGQQARTERREAEKRQQEQQAKQANPRWDLVERISEHVVKLVSA